MREEYIVKSREDLSRIIANAVDRRITYHEAGCPYWDLHLYPFRINLAVKRGLFSRPKKGVVCFLPLYATDPADSGYETEAEERKDRFYVKKWCFPLQNTLLPDIQILPVIIDAYRISER